MKLSFPPCAGPWWTLLLVGSTVWLGALPIRAQTQARDFGDAPAPYPTTLKDDGAWHPVGGPRLGLMVDAEPDGQPTAAADGDDRNPVTAGDDEDGVVFLTPLIPGREAQVQVVAIGNFDRAFLDAWIDFGADGSWAEPDDQIFSGFALSPGTHVLTFAVPRSAREGITYSRFRINSRDKVSYTGGAANGEVEDHLVQISSGRLDFGDAPAPFPTTLKDNGARHVPGGPRLGSLIDTEEDGQPHPEALGDDLNPAGAPGDEDGIQFLTPLVPGQMAEVRVVAGGNFDRAHLDAWIDFGGNGSWADSEDQIFHSQSLSPGTHVLTFDVPENARPGRTFARFRISVFGKLSFVGEAPNGEVEDYLVEISRELLDYGDAPLKYPTLLADDGARHQVLTGFCLGRLVDTEPDGQPDPDAKGDDNHPPGAPSDEDGVVFATPLVPGQSATVQVFLTAPGATAPGRGRLDAWIDFNQNESWNDPGEQIFVSELLTAGNNTLHFVVPADARSGRTFARFRLSREGGLKPAGFAPDGEVEDHLVEIARPLLDYGDAPRPYPTLLAEDGARHSILRGVHLGLLIDGEPDGQPTPDADGDDLNPPEADDEDGVVFTTALVPGRSATVQVTASREGRLYAWIDFNGNGSWADPGDKIFGGQALAPGVNTLTFPVPTGAQVGRTFSRWRFTVQGRDLDFVGAAPDGEVEDHLVFIIPDRERCDLGCEGREFWLTFPGNYAPDADNPTKPSLCIQGPANTTGTVKIEALGFSQDFVIPATFTVQIALPREADLGNLNDAIGDTGIHVVASNDVRITAFNQARHTTDSYLALNTSTLGLAYVVLAFGDVHPGVPPLNGSQFALVATANDTLVTILPSTTVGIRAAGVPYSLLLQPGETYQLRTTPNQPGDLTGTLIVADQPIAVFGSHHCANVPSDAVWFCDYLVEQLLPVNTWGNEFHTAPLATRSGGDTFRFLAAFNNTTVTVNGAVVATLNRGQFHQQTLAGRSHIAANRPILVAQYANSADHDGVVQSDPFMLQVQATRHYSRAYIVCTPASGFPANYVQIVVPAAAAASVQIDGVAVGVAAFDPIPGTAYVAANVPITPGPHVVAAAQPFGIATYGWAEYDSYGHPGCFFFGDVVPPRITPESSSITASVASHPNTPGQAPVPGIAGTAAVADNCTPRPDRPTQSPPAGTLLSPGVHRLTLSLPDESGNIGEAEVLFTVLDPSPVVIECPRDVTVNCESPQGARVDFAVTARTTYDPDVPVVSEPPSGSLFPPGTTEVTSTATSLAGETATCTFRITVVCDARLTATPGPNGLRLSWVGAGALERATRVTGPWETIATDVTSFTVPVTASHAFFRVRY